MMIDRTGGARKKDGRDGQPGFAGMSFGEAQDADGHFLGWTQGKTPYAGSDSLAWRLDPGTDLLLQLHMLPTGKPEPIQSQIGLYFATAPPKRRPAMLRLGRGDIDIPAAQADYRIRETYTCPSMLRFSPSIPTPTTSVPRPRPMPNYPPAAKSG